MRLFSNAIYLEEQSDQCGGIGVTFTGSYFRAGQKVEKPLFAEGGGEIPRLCYSCFMANER